MDAPLWQSAFLIRSGSFASTFPRNCESTEGPVPFFFRPLKQGRFSFFRADLAALEPLADKELADPSLPPPCPPSKGKGRFFEAARADSH